MSPAERDLSMWDGTFGALIFLQYFGPRWGIPRPLIPSLITVTTLTGLLVFTGLHPIAKSLNTFGPMMSTCLASNTAFGTSSAGVRELSKRPAVSNLAAT